MVDFDKVREELEDGVDKAGGVAREIVAKRVAITGAVLAVINLAVYYGWFDISITNSVQQWLGVVFIVATVLGSILVVRPKVTPVGDPKDSNGEALVPVSAALAQVEKAVNAAHAEYNAVKSGDLSKTPDLVKEVTDAAQELVEGVKTDVAAVVAPITEAAGKHEAVEDPTFGGTLTGNASPAAGLGEYSVSSTKPNDGGAQATTPVA